MTLYYLTLCQQRCVLSRDGHTGHNNPCVAIILRVEVLTAVVVLCRTTRGIFSSEVSSAGGRFQQRY